MSTDRERPRPKIVPRRQVTRPRVYFEIGGLMVYGWSVADQWRRVAGYSARILQGTKPSDIPIYLESKFQLLVNLKLAKSLGLTIPGSLLGRADEVIE